jgi:hypothetical protein
MWAKQMPWECPLLTQSGHSGGQLPDFCVAGALMPAPVRVLAVLLVPTFPMGEFPIDGSTEPRD